MAAAYLKRAQSWSNRLLFNAVNSADNRTQDLSSVCTVFTCRKLVLSTLEVNSLKKRKVMLSDFECMAFLEHQTARMAPRTQVFRNVLMR